MGSELIIIPIFFAAVFGVFYLFITSRNKERMALIEKGADASIFYGKKGPLSSTRMIVLNLALLLVGIGGGIFVGGLMSEYGGLEEEIAMPGAIFLFAGLGLFASFFLSKKVGEQ
ncbi:DUF6249 domain-containing protein [Spongiivirga citrea]|uniref:Peptidase A2 domain-containing protein n=1 Tax=Spongiivirga citrea TaxID=1481457 RepID=A0A6M0CDZ0_9FLAO|nr:DUF6249 domain-containing protein [Spongiivirga citrea]NER16025.1 hypothetical protein [Spongiivirga citrea]